MASTPRKHRFFLASGEGIRGAEQKATCADCGKVYGLPYNPKLSPEERINLLTPDLLVVQPRQDFGGAKIPGRTLGYCEAPVLFYVNPTDHTLDLTMVGLGKIDPGQLFFLGNKITAKMLAKIAPQVIETPLAKVSNIGFLLWPITLGEFRHFITQDDLQTRPKDNASLGFAGS